MDAEVQVVKVTRIPEEVYDYGTGETGPMVYWVPEGVEVELTGHVDGDGPYFATPMAGQGTSVLEAILNAIEEELHIRYMVEKHGDPGDSRY